MLARLTHGFLGAAGGGFLGGLALLGLMDLGIGKRTGAGVELVMRKLAQNQTGAGGSRCARRRLGGRTGGGDASGLGRGPRLAFRRRGRRRSLGLALAGQADAALLALDLNRVGAAVRETLANGIALDAAPLQTQRFARRNADRLVAGILRFSHSFRGPEDSNSVTSSSVAVSSMPVPACDGALR
jgi:hypothetical protein